MSKSKVRKDTQYQKEKNTEDIRQLRQVQSCILRILHLYKNRVKYAERTSKTKSGKSRKMWQPQVNELARLCKKYNISASRAMNQMRISKKDRELVLKAI